MALVGLGFDYVDLNPGLLESLLGRVHGTISHLSVMTIRSETDAEAFRVAAGTLPIIHHLSNIAPADPRGPNMTLLRKQDRISRTLRAIWCNEDIGSWDLGPYFLPSFAPPLFESDVAEFVSEGIRKVQQASSVPFLPEIPACSFHAGRLSLGQFFTHVVEGTNSFLLADLSHVYSYALAVDQEPRQVLETLPLHRVWHIHVAGGFSASDDPTYYYDSHDRLTPEPILELMRHAITRCPNLRAVTFEIVPTVLSLDEIESEIERLNSILHLTDVADLI
jgi:uncharacterized protein (UPF0276 family)